MNPKSHKQELLERLLSCYKLDYKKIWPAQSGYRNRSYKVELAGGTLANLIVFKAEPGIIDRVNRADMVSGVLSKNGLPVRRRLDPRVIKMQSPGSQISACVALYNYLPGHTIGWDSYTKDRLKVLGLAMAKIHSALSEEASLTEKIISEGSIYIELEELLGRIETYFIRQDVRLAIQSKLRLKLNLDMPKLKKSVKVGKGLKQQQVLHMDFVRGNILFSEDEGVDVAENAIAFGKARVSGIIDFEKTAYGSPLFDLARTLAFLYVDCRHKPMEQVRKYFLFSGYQKHGKGSIESLRLLNEYIQLFLVHDFYKFLLHNPYESLEQNQHYLRTRDILLEQNMLKYVVED